MPPQLLRPLGERSLVPGFDAPAIRYLETSPFPEDKGAALLLYRLSGASTVVGFLAHNLSTDAQRVHTFAAASEEEARSAVVYIWNAKPLLYLTLRVQDAVVINHWTRAPVTVAPSLAALEGFRAPQVAQRVFVLLPSNPSEAELKAVSGLAARMRERQVDVRCIVPQCADAQERAHWDVHAVQFRLSKESQREVPLLQAQWLE